MTSPLRFSQRIMALGTALKQSETAQLVAMTRSISYPLSPMSYQLFPTRYQLPATSYPLLATSYPLLPIFPFPSIYAKIIPLLK
jgi:hypothetical protein